MSDTIIKVENISKSYVLKHQNKESYTALRDVIANKAKAILQPSKYVSDKSSEEFWALKDISFDIKQGERVGIIGRNGAGKSTLLKVLSRIVSPTSGRITMDGRVASLLEVGTGFHPELSGRENVFLNGSILGMTRAEIQKKFDEIVAFAEVERFLDTPVKRYSSGMYVRLAFAVAAHLEPEILIVDEVLAVGDAEFQKKCLGKMKDVAGQGRTVLFVSHNMAAIQNLCDKAIFLKQGQVQLIGNTDTVVSTYLRGATEVFAIDLENRKDRSGSGAIQFTNVLLLDEHGNNISAFQCGKNVVLRIQFKRLKNESVKNLQISIGIDDDYGQRIAHMNNEITNQIVDEIPVGVDHVDIHIPHFPFKQGMYSFALFASMNGELADWIQEAGTIEVESGDFYGTGKQLPDGQGQFLFDYSFSSTRK